MGAGEGTCKNNGKFKSLTVSACLDPGKLWGFADPGSLGMSLAARQKLGLPKTGLLNNDATTTPGVHRGLASGLSGFRDVGSSQPSGNPSLRSEILCQCGASPQVETA